MVTSKTQSKSIQQTTTDLSDTPVPEPIITNDISHVTDKNISRFYDGSTIFLTGATGFIGKALLEKLLRSCDGISCIYLLIRTKRGMTVDQRLKELIKSPVFDRIREKKPEYFDKIKVIPGDVSQINLGLTEQDRQTLTNNITIAFHSAATVRYTAPYITSKQSLTTPLFSDSTKISKMHSYSTLSERNESCSYVKK